ncbi:MAG: DUF2237 family protein, partial [Sphaerochaetaceae bacterium]|nr:DUF2237 family protein [Sphaerochaetaceae bacterium]
MSCHDDPTAFLCHPDVLIIDPDDSVAVALRQLDPSYRIEVPQGSVTLLDTILPGHKFALKDIQEGETVIKYGHSIGIAVKTIQRGELVHTHNLTSNLEDQSYYYHSPRSSHLRSSESQTFQGYRRNNGSVGIRNDIWIIPTVGCIAQCIYATEEFLEYSKKVGNDLATPMPKYNFAGVKPGQSWCLSGP